MTGSEHPEYPEHPEPLESAPDRDAGQQQLLETAEFARTPGARGPLPELTLSRAALDRDYRSRDVPLSELLAEPAARMLVLDEKGEAPTETHADRMRLLLAHPRALPDHEQPVLFLGRTLDTAAPVFATAIPGARDRLPSPWTEASWVNLFAVGTLLDDRDAGLFTEALALANWHASHGFSPRTGHPTVSAKGGWERHDAETGAELFPRTDPAVIMAVTDHDDRILLGHNAMWDAGRYSVLAGFVEPGESLESAVIREVFEETGLRVVEPEYVGSQPWPFPASLMLGFEARLAPGEDPTPHPDGDELTDLRWFSRDDLRSGGHGIKLPGRTSIARALVERWAGGPVPD